MKRAPNGTATGTLMVKLEPSVLTAYKQRAERQGISLSEWVRRAIFDRAVRQDIEDAPPIPMVAQGKSARPKVTRSRSESEPSSAKAESKRGPKALSHMFPLGRKA